MGSMKDFYGAGAMPYPGNPGFKERTTSREAAEAIAPRARTLRNQVLSLLVERSPEGMTADEIASVLGETVLAIRPRVSELNKLSLIQKTGERRANKSGQDAHVWRVA